jgi:type IV pilus assembly protein PilP
MSTANLRVSGRYRMQRALFAAISAVGLLMLSGCADDTDELRQYIDQVKARKSTDIEPIPQIQPYTPFTYIAEGRRDPFANAPTARASGAGGGIMPDLKRNKEPLEEFPLDALQMVGTLSIKGQQFALIKAPDAVVHRVAVGNYMGQNYGKIMGITDTEISLKEIVPDGFGGYVERPATLLLIASK